MRKYPAPGPCARRSGIALLSCVFLLLWWGAVAVAAPPPRAITVVLDDNYPPYSFRGPDGNLQGLLRDWWQLWSRKTGITVHLEGMDWARAKAVMAAGRADVIDTMFSTPERQRSYLFSEPYTTIDVSIFFHDNISGIAGVKTLQGFTVGVKDGDATVDWLAEHGITSVVKFPSYGAMIDAAADGSIKVFCIDNPPALYFLYKKNIEGQFRHSPPLYSGSFHRAYHKSDAALMAEVEQGFAQIDPAEWHQLQERWLGAPLAHQRDVALVRYTLYALLAASALALALVGWNRGLRRRVAVRTIELTAALEALRLSERHYQDLVSTTPVGVFETDREGRCVYVNQRWQEISGLNLESARERWLQAIYGEDRARVLEDWRTALREQRGVRMEYRMLRGGEVIWVLCELSPVQDNGELCGYIGSLADITERKQAEARIQFLAHHDALTGLPNRLLVADRLEQAIAYADRSQSRAALLFLDLDQFKTINDSLGHPIGDALLQATAQRLRGCLRETDSISRQGGDEFLIVLSEVSDTDAVAKVARKVLEQLAQPLVLNGRELATSVSIGVAVYPEDGADFETLLKKADIAMYHAKEAGRNACRFYTEQMNIDADEHLRLRNSLQRALEREEFVLYYQPQVDLHSGALVGAEALVRWRHPEFGLLPPDRFIGIAEDCGLIVPLGEWVLREACRQAVQWREGGRSLTVAVNLSAVQFRRSDLAGTVRRALAQTGLAPQFLELELTESMLLDTENVPAAARECKALGVQLAIDDFGTGYSNLAYLRRFHFDKLKIDRSFVCDVLEDAGNAAIVKAIIQMAHSLNLKAVAEGVEDEALLAYLRGLRCDQAQGYYFARPMPAAEFADYLGEIQLQN